MIFKGICIKADNNSNILGSITELWDTMSKLYGEKNIKILRVNMDKNTCKYIVGLKRSWLKSDAKKMVERMLPGYDVSYEIVLIPNKNWNELECHIKDIEKEYKRVSSEGKKVTFAVASYNRKKDTCEVKYNSEEI